MKKIILTSFTILALNSLNIINAQTQVTKTEFSDNSSSLVGKKITVLEAWYFSGKNKGSYSEVKELTLRKMDDAFETKNAKNYPESNQANYANSYFRIAEIDGQKIVLIIPKSLSEKMPNMVSGFINITGVVKSSTVIVVSSIVRN